MKAQLDKHFITLLLLGLVFNTHAQTATILVNGYSIVSGDTVSICSAAAQYFNVNHTGIGTSVTYSWSFQNGTPSTSTVKSPAVAFTGVGYNNVQVFAYGSDTVSAQIIIKTWPQIIPGSVTGAQIICIGATPAALSRTNAAGGNGVFSYEWQYSIGSTSNYINSGQSGLSYTLNQSLYNDTWFRVKVTSVCGVYFTNDVKISVAPPISPGTIQTAVPNNTICAGSGIIIQHVSAPVGAKVWQQRVVGTTPWLPVVGNINPNSITVQNILQNTEFRVKIQSSSCIDSVTNTLLVTVIPQIVLSSIQFNGSSTRCYNTLAPTMWVGYSNALSNVSFSWYRRFAISGGWSNWFSTGSNNDTLNFSTPLYATSQFVVRVVNSSPALQCQPVYSDTLTFTVSSPIFNSTTIGANQSICNGQQPAILIKPAATGGNTTFSYMWQDSSASSGSWQNTGVTTLSYQPGPLTESTWFRVRTQAASCGGIFLSSVLQVSVSPPLTGGVLQPDTVNLCDGGSVTLNLTPISGGNGTITRQWQYKPAVASTWANIPGVGTNATSYTAQNLQQNFHYRVIISSGCPTNDTSNIAVVNVASPMNAGHIVTSSGYPNACPGMPAPPLQLVGYGGGRGPYNFVWQKKVGSGTWFVTGPNQDHFTDLIPLLQNSSYRVVVTDQGGCGAATSDTLTIVISALPGLNSSIDGRISACSGSQGNYYRITPGFADSVYWQFGSGTLMNNGIDKVFMDVGTISSTTTDTLYATLFDAQIGCEHTIKLPINLSGNIAPQAGNISLKQGTNTMIYSDSLSGFSFVWGEINRVSGYENIYQNSNFHRYTIAGTIDTTTYLYFVRVTNSVCDNRIFYNTSAQPFGIAEEVLKATFALYPNPNYGVLHLRGPVDDLVRAQIVGINGLQLSIDMHQLKEGVILPETIPAGIYTLVLTTSGGVQTFPFVRINQ